MRILGKGLREIDRQLFYSAAWLDDPRPGSEEPGLVHVLRGEQPRALVHSHDGATSPAGGDGSAG